MHVLHYNDVALFNILELLQAKSEVFVELGP